MVDTEKFVAGAAAAFVLHESAHLLGDAVFDAGVEVRAVHLGPLPFFAVSHRPGLPRREEFTISAAGFWTQEATAEWLLDRHPRLREEAAPFAKGAFAFDLLTSIGYGIVAIARAGPPERDTRGMSLIGVPEPAIGTLIIVPAVFDGYRYLRPDATWAKWVSRAAKVATVAVVLKR